MSESREGDGLPANGGRGSAETKRDSEVQVIVVAGRKFSVRTTASEEHLAALVEAVEERALKASGGRGVSMEGIVLAAVALAAEAEEQRERVDRIARLAGDGLRDLLVRVEDALGQVEAVDDDAVEDDD